MFNQPGAVHANKPSTPQPRCYANKRMRAYGFPPPPSTAPTSFVLGLQQIAGAAAERLSPVRYVTAQ